MKVVLHINSEEADQLNQVLSEAWDAGPPGEGWQTDSLQRLTEKVEKSIRVARESAPRCMVGHNCDCLSYCSDDSTGTSETPA